MDTKPELGPITTEQFHQMMREYDEAGNWLAAQLRNKRPTDTALLDDDSETELRDK